MRHSFLAVALATALGTATPAAVAADHSAELAALKAQLAELTAKVAELEARTDAQSDINIGTQQNIENIAATTPKVETKGGIKVTSPDRKFEASLGGRIHFDAYAFDRDIAATTGTTPPITDGNCARPEEARSSDFSGASDEPKSTVPALIWAMPPPEPMDW